MVSNTIEVKQLNVERVRRAVQRRKNCTKSGVADETQLSIATCGTILNEMLESGEIIKIDQKDLVIGRPAGLFAYNSDFQHVLCLCLDYDEGDITVRCAVANALGHVIHRENHSPKQVDYDDLEELIGTFLGGDTRITAVGIGIPGVAHDGKVDFCEIKTLENVDIAGRLAKKYSVEVLVENDMNCITYFLYEKQAEPSGDLAVIFFPKGSESCVGCGFMINGRIHHGATMFSGEVSYAASGFGISRDKQQKLLGNAKLFHQFAAQVLLTVVTTINPGTAVFMGKGITQADLDAIRKNCLQTIPERHIPRLTLDNDIAENYLNGVIRLLLDTIQFRHCM